MAKKLPVSEPPPQPPVDDECFRFPKLTEERAKEIAGEIIDLSQFDKDVMRLVSELAMGLAPADVRDTSDLLNRADAAHSFVSEIYRHTVAFDERVRAYIQEIAESAQGGIQQ